MFKATFNIKFKISAHMLLLQLQLAAAATPSTG
jgi:hypothetical protein